MNVLVLRKKTIKLTVWYTQLVSRLPLYYEIEFLKSSWKFKEIKKWLTDEIPSQNPGILLQ